MSRWDPDARGRLERAALELFAEQGFAQTTVPQIAKRAGLTTRTFFRYFADKREVLFSGEDDMRARAVDVLRSAPPNLSPLELIEYGLEHTATTVFEPLFDNLRNWRAVVASDEGLRERELRKQQLMTEAVVAALGELGFDEQTAELMARLSTLVLQNAVARWVEQPANKKHLTEFIHESLDRLRSVVAGAKVD